MRFNYVNSIKHSKLGGKLTYLEVEKVMRSERVMRVCKRIAEGEKELKQTLPAVSWVGVSDGETRLDGLHSTGFYMLDLDHCDDPHAAWRGIQEHVQSVMGTKGFEELGLALVHVTPSGKGLRFVLKFTQDFPSFEQHMAWAAEKLQIAQYGDFDTVTKDLARMSFVPCFEYVKYVNGEFFNNDDELKFPIDEKNELFAQSAKEDKGSCEVSADDVSSDGKGHSGAEPKGQPLLAEVEQLREECRYGETKVVDIAQAWVKDNGVPAEGTRHSFYLVMVKDFRQLTDNDARKIYAVLPAFDLPDKERWDLCKGITKSNRSSRFSVAFYAFLCKHNYYVQKGKNGKYRDREATAAEVFDMEWSGDADINLPPLPPIFKQFVAIAPKDFKVPAIYAIMPVLGALTTNYYCRYLDGATDTTTFMHIIYAPQATGKSYADRIFYPLTKLIRKRDRLNSRRMEIYDNEVNTRGSNEKAPKAPPVIIRISQANTSQVQFLTEQRLAQGRHQIVYVHELDTWAKGEKAGGNSKNDMYREMWDNGAYGQSMKTSGSFRGEVNLYCNALVTGTPGSMDRYFKNLENGLVTRFSFCEIENQRFASIPMWKPMTAKAQEVVDKIVTRLDEDLYTRPLEAFDEDELWAVEDENYDQEVPWKMSFKPKKEIDTSWFHKDINMWLERERVKASTDLDEPRDIFRRRIGRKMNRLALMCVPLYNADGKLTEKQKREVRDFCLWWGSMELENMMKTWAQKFRDSLPREVITIPQQTLFESLGETFTKDDAMREAASLNIKTRWKHIKCIWSKAGLIDVSEDGLVFTKRTNNGDEG